MHALFSLLIRSTAPVWDLIAKRPWASAGILGLLSIICFALGVPYLRAILGMAAGAVLIFKSERDQRAERARQYALHSPA
ncbi:hypothetical protein [Muricoccus radiodurans]|uniref:hypothetical protein n=1 Tax=Muricoccus radiodurans TaxID=2231721 RepID=UPI003CEF9F04